MLLGRVADVLRTEHVDLLVDTGAAVLGCVRVYCWYVGGYRCHEWVVCKGDAAMKTGSEGRPWIELERPKPAAINDDAYRYFGQIAPTELSERCKYWVRQIERGWLPNKHISATVTRVRQNGMACTSGNI